MPASQGRSSVGAASRGGLPSGRSVPARTSTVRVPAPVSQREVDRVAHRHAAPLERLRPARGRARRAPARRSPGSRRGRRRRERVGEIGMVGPRRPAGSSGTPGATSRPHRITMPGPCHSSSRRAMSRQAARELSVGSGGSRRSPTTSTRRPRATGSVAVGGWPSAAGVAVPTPVSASAPIRRPSCHLRGSPTPPQFGRNCPSGGCEGRR